MKNNSMARAVAAKVLMYLRELLFPPYKVFDFRDISEAKGVRKFLVFNSYSSY